MNLLKESIDAFSTCIDVLVLYIFLGSVAGKKLINRNKLAIVYLVYFALTFTAVLIVDSPIILLTAMFLFDFVMSLFYKSKVFIKLFACISLAIMAVLTEILAGIALAIATGQSVEILSSNIVYYIEGVVISKALLLVFAAIIQHKKMPIGSKVAKTLFLPLLALPVTTFFIIYVMSEYAYKLAEPQSTIVVAIASVMLIISNILVFYLFEKQLKQDEETRTATLAKQQLQYQTRYYKEIADKYRLSNKTVHDTKNLLFAISILLRNNEVEKAKSKIDELSNTALGVLNMIKTGNEALDALLNSKAQEMQALNIDFKPNVFINANNQIDDIDLCIIIGNALDNAIEACSKFKNRQERSITLRMIQNDDLLTIEMINTSIELPKLTDGKIVTAKSDKALHGFGLQSIEEIVNKYNGNLSLSQSNGVFTLKIYVHNEIN